MLVQALSNLVDNALRISDSGGQVLLTAMKDMDSVVISIVDQGPGIPNNEIDRIFERFYTVDKSRSRKNTGTGLGLSIAKHIVMAHGGTIDVDSTVGSGSSFNIKLRG